MKTLTLCCVWLLSATIALHAQTLYSDSARAAAVKADVKKFKLGKADFKAYKQHPYNSNADYFKPATALVADTANLRDSAYVKAFRIAAFQKTRKRHTVGHYFLVGGAIYLGITAVATLIVFSIGLSHFD